MSSESDMSDRPKYLRGLVGRGLYAAQINNWYKYFAKNQFLILGFNDLVNEPESVFNQIYTFLGVKSLDFKTSGYSLRNKSQYKYSMSKNEHRTLSKFYEEPNKELLDLLGYQINW